MNWLLWALISGAVLSAYVVFIRPTLRDQPSFKEFYEQEESFWKALRLKLAGLKQKVTTTILFVAGIVIAGYDQIAPLVLETGVDVTSLTDKIPAKAWPFILMGAAGILQYFRRLSDQRAAAKEKELEAIAEGK